MSTVVAPPHTERIEEFRLDFECLDCPGAGYSFECDKDENLCFSEISGHAHSNLLHCFISEDVGYVGVTDCSRDIRHGATVQCDCGATVFCDSHWANGCDNCPREYNFNGQQLAPRSQWGSEFNSQPEEDVGLYSPENCR